MDESGVDIKDAVMVFDTTLRDGEQSPGAALTIDEKVGEGDDEVGYEYRMWRWGVSGSLGLEIALTIDCLIHHDA